MADEETLGETITITDTENIFENISTFYSKQKYSDVDLLLDDIKIPSHKVILAARSKYFDSLLTSDSKQSELIITDVPNSKAFRKTLKYIYTGYITFVSKDLDDIFNVIELADKYELKFLEKAIGEKLTSMINMDNVFDILNKANLYDMENLKNVCLEFMDNHSLEVLENDGLNNLTQKSMVSLLEPGSFIAPEIEIFKSVAKWCTINKDDGNLVMATIRFNLMTMEEIVANVYPTQLIEEVKLMKILFEVLNSSPETANVRLAKEGTTCYEENLASTKYKAQILSGTDSLFLFSDEENVENYGFHYVGEANGITIRLSTAFYINHIYMRLWDKDKSNYSYYIEVSQDQRKWQKVIDYSKYPCRSCQNLYFDKVAVQYVRIVGTSSSVSNQFRITSVKLFLKSDVPKVLDGIIHPNENVALLHKGASVIEPHDDSGKLLNDSNEYSSHETGNGNIVIQLAQPYTISNIKLSLGPKYCLYKFKVETSTDKISWSMAIDHTTSFAETDYNGSFDARPTVFIKITGTEHEFNYKLFQCKNLQCFWKRE